MRVTPANRKVAGIEDTNRVGVDRVIHGVFVRPRDRGAGVHRQDLRTECQTLNRHVPVGRFRRSRWRLGFHGRRRFHWYGRRLRLSCRRNWCRRGHGGGRPFFSPRGGRGGRRVRSRPGLTRVRAGCTDCAEGGVRAGLSVGCRLSYRVLRARSRRRSAGRARAHVLRGGTTGGHSPNFLPGGGVRQRPWSGSPRQCHRDPVSWRRCGSPGTTGELPNGCSVHSRPRVHSAVPTSRLEFHAARMTKTDSPPRVAADCSSAHAWRSSRFSRFLVVSEWYERPTNLPFIPDSVKEIPLTDVQTVRRVSRRTFTRRTSWNQNSIRSETACA